MSLEHQRMLLEFVTASDRVPLKGLDTLQFVIQRNGPDTDRLPTALTCFGRLLLPEYSSSEKLQNRLITAIENARGFGLV
jgi:ubiquitin-protein ligase E3 A